MSNSPLATYINISPSKNARGNTKIDTITIHHMAIVNFTGKECANRFARPEREGSANYCIGTWGDIALSVPEDYRAWTSSNRDNDYRAITIEVANCKGDPNWEVSDASMEALILLLTDICKRNGIPKLLWKNDKKLIGQIDKQNMTVHQWFHATGCPGPYLMSKMGDIANAVNERLSSENQNESKEESKEDIKPRKTVDELATEVIKGLWGNGEERKKRLTEAGYDYAAVQNRVDEVMGKKPKEEPKDTSFKVKISIKNLNIRKGPGTNYERVKFIDPGVYTIVEVRNNFGKLKSGIGWVSMNYVTRM